MQRITTLPTALDEELIRKLPLPLAQLYRRAHDAATPPERHNAAYFLWEAGLKLLASVAIVEYVELGSPNQASFVWLQNLARPAVGHWWEFLRNLTPVLADAPQAEAGQNEFAKLRTLLLGPARADFPAATSLSAALAHVLDGSDSTPGTVSLAQLFNQLVRYRNREIGHGAAGLRTGDFYDRMGNVLMAGLAEVLGRIDVLAGQQLIYVANVRRQPTGAWQVDRFELIGEHPKRLEPLDIAEDATAALPRPQRIYLNPGGQPAMRLVHPLLYFDDELGQTFYMNSRPKELRVQYLCYSTGDTLDQQDLLERDHEELLGRVLLRKVNRQALDALAAQTPEAEGPAHPAASARPTIGEFQLLSQIGAGSMGTVYRAWQPLLGREVALKCLKHSGQARSKDRFQREIRALGCVTHPHLVKIFTSGATGLDWYYAMELIEGADLGSVCKHLSGSIASSIGEAEWQAAVSTARDQARTEEQPLSASPAREANPTSPPPDNPPLPLKAVAEPSARATSSSHVRQMVELMRQVADAAHALHEAGVIHRDIKPGNIMVTPGSSQAVLMDLGLAQMAADEGAALTDTKQFVGTVRYASPEQVLSARRVDRRADVYSLGATLWELLTLRPLFGATDEMTPFDLMLKVQSEAPERSRKLNPMVSADLEAIVLKCLDKDRNRRYATAADLSADLGRWLRGEPVAAQPPTLRYLAATLVRRHRLGLGTIAAVLTAIAAGTAGFVYQNDAARHQAEQLNARLKASNADLKATNKRLDEAVDKLKAAGLDLTEARDRAQKHGDAALQVLSSVIFDIQRKLENVPAAHGVRRNLLKTALSRLEELGVSMAGDGRIDRNLAATHSELGDLFLRVGNEEGLGGAEQALAQYQRAQDILKRLSEAKPSDKDAQRDLSVSYENLGDISLKIGKAAEALDYYRQGLEIRRRLTKDDPQNTEAQRDLSVSYIKFGNVSLQIGKAAEALSYYEQGLEISQRLAKDDPQNTQAQRDLSVSYNNLGDVSRQIGKAAEALSYYQQGLEISRRLTKDDPQNAQAQRDLSISYNKLGDVSLKIGKAAEALSYYQQDLEISQRLAKDDPQNAQAQRDLSISYNKLGDVSLKIGKAAEALSYYQQDLEISQRLAKDDPQNTQAQRDLSVSYNNLGDVSLQIGRAAEALSYYQQGLEISQRLAKDDPQNTQAQRDLSVSYNNLGDVSLQIGKAAEALSYYQQDLEISRRLAKDDPQNAQAQRDLSVSYNKLGDVSLKIGKAAEALSYYQQDLEISRRLAKDDPQNAEAQRDLMVSHYKIGRAWEGQYEFAQAAAAYELGLSVLRAMVASGQLAEPSTDVTTLEQTSSRCKKYQQAAADPEFVLKQPKEQVANLLAMRALALASHGQAEAAEVAAKTLLALETKQPIDAYHAAGAYSRCAAAMLKGNTPPSPEALAEQKRFQSLAIETLRIAIAAGFDNFDLMATDEDLTPIRDLPEFQALLEKKKKAPTPDAGDR